MIWIFMTALLALGAVTAAAPFLRTPRDAANVDQRRRFYARQVAEIDQDEKSGLLSAEEAAALRIEAQRRVLNQSPQVETGTGDMKYSKPAAATVIAAMVLATAGGLYAIKGSPQVSAVRNAPAAPAQSAPANAAAQSVGSVDAMIDGLKARLAAEPENADGWRMLGWSYFNIQRFGEAADAYAKAVALAPDNASYQTALGEALVMSAGGFVTQQALDAFSATLALDPSEPRARYFRGLALDQSGDTRGALDVWIDMVNSAQSGDDWADDLRLRITARAAETGIDVSGRFDAAPTVDARAPAPSAQQVQAALEMPAADRQAMIEGMVARLAAKLEAEPNDVDGWVRLIRSRIVLGDLAAAGNDLASARQVFRDDAAQREKIEQAAQALGLKAN